MEVPVRANRVVPGLLLPIFLTAANCAAPQHREKIPEALTNKVRSHPLSARDQPIAVGTPAPPVPGLAAVPTAIVFYRGHW